MSDFLLALKKERRTLSDRVYNIDVCLRNKLPTSYTPADLESESKRLAEVEVAIEAIKLSRKCVPLNDIRFAKVIRVKDLREALSHPDDQDKSLWAFVQQGATFEHVIGINQSEYEGKPTINLLINVLPDGKK